MKFVKLFGNKIRAKDVIYSNGQILENSKRIINPRAIGQSPTVNIRDLIPKGQYVFALLVVMRSWVAVNAGAKAYIVTGIQSKNYVSSTQIFDSGTSGYMTVGDCELNFVFHDNNGGGYSIIPLIY